MLPTNKILIVDDEPRNQRIIMEALEDIAEVAVANSGEEALIILDSFDADLVLLDIMMPGMDGYTVCKKIRENPKFSLTKIIMVSGKAMVDERLQGYEVGADDYMTKPFVPEELMAKSRVFLRLANAEKDILTLNATLETKVHSQSIELMTAEEKMFTNLCASDLSGPLRGIQLLVAHSETLLENDPLDKKVLHEKLRSIHKLIDKINYLFDLNIEDKTKVS